MEDEKVFYRLGILKCFGGLQAIDFFLSEVKLSKDFELNVLLFRTS